MPFTGRRHLQYTACSVTIFWPVFCTWEKKPNIEYDNKKECERKGIYRKKNRRMMVQSEVCINDLALLSGASQSLWKSEMARRTCANSELSQAVPEYVRNPDDISNSFALEVSGESMLTGTCMTPEVLLFWTSPAVHRNFRFDIGFIRQSKY